MNFRELLTRPQPPLSIRCLRPLLSLLSWPYRMVVRLRNLSFDAGLRHRYRSRLLTISVGNLSVGGTGKSPVVAWLARWLRKHHLRVAILSRGYGQLADGRNDEALELELVLPDVPHLQDPQRAASAALAEEELDMQVLLLDDGFQHRQVARDLDIVLIDATTPAHGNRLLPAGILREPFASLKRAQVVMLTRVDQASSDWREALRRQVLKAKPNALLVEARHRPSQLLFYADHPNQESAWPLSRLQNARVVAFCGIGNPQAFFQSLRDLGANLLATRTWPDHHHYAATDVQELERWCLDEEAEFAVCTMKDWVKLQVRRLNRCPLAALSIDLEIVSGQAALEQQLAELVEPLSGA